MQKHEFSTIPLGDMTFDTMIVSIMTFSITIDKTLMILNIMTLTVQRYRGK